MFLKNPLLNEMSRSKWLNECYFIDLRRTGCSLVSKRKRRKRRKINNLYSYILKQILIFEQTAKR
jgi:hypothetical protein